MQCSKCGAFLDSDSRFCKSCGAAAPDSEETRIARPQSAVLARSDNDDVVGGALVFFGNVRPPYADDALTTVREQLARLKATQSP